MIHDFATLPRAHAPIEPPPPANPSARPAGPYVIGLLFLIVVSISLTAIGFESESKPQIDLDYLAIDELDILPAEIQAASPAASMRATAAVAGKTPASMVTQRIESSVAQAKPKETPKPDVSSTVELAVQTEDTPVRWSFYDRLPDAWPVPIQQGVYVDKEVAARERPIYELQAASFRNWSDAQRLQSVLATRGLQARVNSRTNQSGVEWHQVVVGPFDHNSNLNRAQDVLVTLNLMPLRRRVN